MPAKIYDWNKWFSLDVFTIRRGVDYHCSQTGMATQIRNAASSRRLSITMVDQDDQFVIAVTSRDGVLVKGVG